MKLPNTKRGWPAGEPDKSWTNEQMVAYLRNQHSLLTEPDGKMRKAVGATDEDIREIAASIARLEKATVIERSRLN